MMTRNFILNLCVALTVLIVSIAPTPTEARTTLKIGSLAPEGTPWFDELRRLGEDWERISNGEISVRFYPGGVAGDEPNMVRKMRVGQLHGATLTTIGMGHIDSSPKILQTPFMFRDDAELLCTRSKIRGELEDKLRQSGFVLLTWADTGWARFFAKEPIVRPADLKNRKMFFWSGDDEFIGGWRDWGVEPVPMQLTDLYVALQSGLVDTMATTPLAALSFQWFPFAPNMTDLRLAPVVGGIVLSNRAWAKVPEKYHDAFKEAAEKRSAILTEASAEFEEKAIKAMQEHNLIVVPVPPDAVAEWEETARQDLYPLLEGTVSAEIRQKAIAARDECRQGE